jgi:predicted DNA-binding transcriptional regulator AlpA
VARHAARCRLLRLAQAHRRLLHLRRASGCFGTSCGLSRDSLSTTSPRAGSSRGSSSTTSPSPRGSPRRLIVDYFTFAARPGATARRAARRRLLRLRRASECLGTSRGSPHRLVVDYFTNAVRPGASAHARLFMQLVVDYFASRRLVVDYFTYVARPVASARCAFCRVTHRRLVRLAQAHRRLLRLRCATECLGTSRGSSRDLSRDSSSTTSPRAGSSSTTSPPPRGSPRRLIIDYFTFAARPGAPARRAARRRLLRLRRASECLGTSRGSPHRLVVDYFTNAARPGASAHARLFMQLVVDYFASRRLVVDYFTYVARPVASARRAACRVTHRRLVRLAQAHRRLLRLRCATECLGTSRGSSRDLSRDSSSTTSPRAGSSSTTSPAPHVRIPRHVARLDTRLVIDYFTSRRLVIDYFASRRLVVDYFTYAARPVASNTSRGLSRDSSSTTSPRVRVPRHVARLAAQARRRLLHIRRASGCLGTRASLHAARRRLLRLA